MGWAFFAVSHSATSLLKARGMFATQMWTYAALAVMFVTFVYVGARDGAALGTACGVGAYAVIAGPLSVYIAIRRIGGRWRDVLGIFVTPLAIATVAVGAGWALAQLLPQTRLGLCARIVTVLAISGAIYLPLIRWLSPAAMEEMIERARGLLGRGRAGAATTPASAL
jgi:hypothetical protein